LNQNLIVLFGVNGVGKSTIANRLGALMVNSVALSGSELLMSAFKGLDRLQLEVLSPEEKMRMLEPAFLEAFQRSDGEQFVILDTHLVVPIRKNGKLVLENVWSEQFMPYMAHVFYISSDPSEILQRRIRDSEISGRNRDLNIEHIRRDQEINVSVFEETFIATTMSSAVVTNEESRLNEVVESIIRIIT
jgi:adenylate kinase